jgi:hypothetical protein
MLTAAIVACAMSFLPAGTPVSAQGATPAAPILKKAKERGAGAETEVIPTEKTTSGGLARQQRMALCLESWDAQTHMSKSEWRAACERSVKDYPNAFR